MAWKFVNVEDQIKELVNLYYEGILSMSDICKKFEISPKTAYKWLRRFEIDGDLGLLYLSKAPIQSKRTYSAKQIEMAINLKCKRLKWGPKKILAKLRKEFPREQWPA